MNLLGAGFRPFFLGAGVWLTVAMGWWGATLAGLAPAPNGALTGVAWHAHELLFGFVGAVLYGFFLTAPAVWTKTPPPRGAVLGALAALWAIARVSNSAGGPLGVWIDTLLPMVIAFDVARRVIGSKRWPNLPFPPLLALYGAAAGAHHLQWLTTREASMLALDAVLVILVVFTGRIVPMFTRNAEPESQAHDVPALKQLSTLSIAVMLVGNALTLCAPQVALVGAVAAIVAGLSGLARHRHWGLGHTWRRPLLWVLHVGMIWMYVGLVARGLAQLWWPAAFGAATHILTVGALGTLTVGMMARVALGHSGRPLIAPAPMGWAFGAVSLATLARVAWVHPAAWSLAAALLSGVGMVYLARYGQILVSPRIDGRPG